MIIKIRDAIRHASRHVLGRREDMVFVKVIIRIRDAIRHASRHVLGR